MIPTDTPRLHLCPACVTLRGLEAGETHVRIAADMDIKGPCTDCAAVGELEAWRLKEAPPAAETLRAFPPEEDTCELRRVRPFLTRISIKPDALDKETKSAAGVIIPQSSEVGGNPTRTGIVLAKGERVKDVSPGDWVLYYERPALPFECRDAGDVHVIDVGDVLAVLGGA